VLDGVFTIAQADRGDAVYSEKCAPCHEGTDVDGPPLTGTPFIDRWREDTLQGLFDFISTEMPQRAPGSLSEPVYLDVLAHLLRESHYPPGREELSKQQLATTLLVGSNGPQPLPSGALVGVVGCLAQTPVREWVVNRASAPARVRAASEIVPAEAAAAAAVSSGTEAFVLQNVGEGETALPGAGHRVLLKGALTQRAGSRRIHVTAVAPVAGACD
jgi:hypothetical protein